MPDGTQAVSPEHFGNSWVVPESGVTVSVQYNIFGLFISTSTVFHLSHIFFSVLEKQDEITSFLLLVSADIR